MAVTNRIQLGRESSVFVVQETTAGTQVQPSATDLVIPSGAVEFNQTPSYTNSTEVRNSRSLKARFQDMTPAGTWSLPMYCRPSGTAGSVPDGHVLLYAAFGSTTTYAGSSVTYTLKNIDHISMTIYVGMKDMVFALIGATVNEFKATFQNKGAINMNFSGGFMTMKWAGKADTTAWTSGTKTFTLAADDAKQFCAGMKIKIWDASAAGYLNAGTGYAISSVATTSVVIDTDPTYTWDTGDWIEGWLPTGTEVGYAIEARTGACYFDGGSTASPIISSDVTITNNIKYLEDEVSTNLYPTSYIADARNVVAATNLYIRTDDLNFFKDSGIGAAADTTATNLVLRGGDTAGKKVQIALPQCQGSVPQITGDLEKTMSVDFQGLASASLEDEIKVTFY